MTRLSICLILAVVCATAACDATVTVVVRTYDGLVVAADSRITLTDSAGSRVASDFGEKVKRVGRYVAVTFNGAAYLYDTETDLRSIGSLVDQYKNQSGISDSSRTDPHSVVLGLDSLLLDLYDKHQRSNYAQKTLQIRVCGYDSTGKRPIYQLTYPNLREASSKEREFDVYGSLDTIYASGVPCAYVGGQIHVWSRLIKGYDPRLLEHKWFREVEVIVTDSLDSAVVDTTVERKPFNPDDLRYNIRYDLMTLQDAIDFAIFIVRATIEAQRFDQNATRGVGGVIDIAVITSDGFKWLQRKRLHGEGPSELIQ